jgi:hypothetical protein
VCGGRLRIKETLMPRRIWGLAWLPAALLAAAAAGQESNFDQCGDLVRGAECVLLRADDESLWVLDDRGEFDVGDRVHVIGEADANCVSTCQEGDGCVTVASIRHCDGAFVECGTLVQGVECVLFESDTNFLFAVENLGDFDVGDRVRVAGTLEGDCVTACLQTHGCISENTIAPASAAGGCDDGAAPPPIVCPTAAGGLVALGALGLIRTRRAARSGAAR